MTRQLRRGTGADVVGLGLCRARAVLLWAGNCAAPRALSPAGKLLKAAGQVVAAGQGSRAGLPSPQLSAFSPLHPVRRHRHSAASLLPRCSGNVIPADSSFWSFLQGPRCSVRGTQQVGVTGWSAESPRRRRALDPVLPWQQELAGKCRAGRVCVCRYRGRNCTLNPGPPPPPGPALWVADMARKLLADVMMLRPDASVGA